MWKFGSDFLQFFTSGEVIDFVQTPQAIPWIVITLVGSLFAYNKAKTATGNVATKVMEKLKFFNVRNNIGTAGLISLVSGPTVLGAGWAAICDNSPITGGAIGLGVAMIPLGIILLILSSSPYWNKYDK